MSEDATKWKKLVNWFENQTWGVIVKVIIAMITVAGVIVGLYNGCGGKEETGIKEPVERETPIIFKGEVMDRESNPIKNAEVRITDVGISGLTRYTDDVGDFNIETLEKISSRVGKVKVFHSEYENYSRNITIGSDTLIRIGEILLDKKKEEIKTPRPNKPSSRNRGEEIVEPLNDAKDDYSEPDKKTAVQKEERVFSLMVNYDIIEEGQFYNCLKMKYPKAEVEVSWRLLQKGKNSYQFNGGEVVIHKEAEIRDTIPLPALRQHLTMDRLINHLCNKL